MLIIFVVIFCYNYRKIPSKTDHISRNQYNIFPIGKFVSTDNYKYIDSDGVVWYKRTFLNSLFHNPFKYYVFESYNALKTSSFEVEILKKKFDNGSLDFTPASFNYYSSFRFPISHFFADILPIIIYFGPDYKIYEISN